MKRTVILAILLFLVIEASFGQMRTENRWLIGRWTGTIASHTIWSQGRETVVPARNLEIIFNDNGTGKFLGEDIIFSVGGYYVGGAAISITIFTIADLPDISDRMIFLYRVNDQRMVLVYNTSEYSSERGFTVELNKRN